MQDRKIKIANTILETRPQNCYFRKAFLRTADWNSPLRSKESNFNVSVILLSAPLVKLDKVGQIGSFDAIFYEK